MELLLIRHAQSHNNALLESQRVEDPGITELGQQQARQLAQRLASWNVELLLTSAFRRALETAEHLRQTSGLRPLVWSELHEVGGCYAGHLPGQMVGRPGLSGRQIREQFPEFEIQDEISDEGWWASRPRESAEQSWQRAKQQARRLLDAHAGRRRVACVVHADFKSLLLDVLLGSRWQQLAAEPLYNTGVTWLNCAGRHVVVQQFNNVDHLSGDCLSD